MAWKMMEQDLTNEYGICWSHSMQMVWGSFGGTSVGDVLDTLTYIDFYLQGGSLLDIWMIYEVITVINPMNIY